MQNLLVIIFHTCQQQKIQVEMNKCEMYVLYFVCLICVLTLYSVNSLHNIDRHDCDHAYEENDKAVEHVVGSGGEGEKSLMARVPDKKSTCGHGFHTKQVIGGVDDVEEEMGMVRYGIRILG